MAARLLPQLPWQRPCLSRHCRGYPRCMSEAPDTPSSQPRSAKSGPPCRPSACSVDHLQYALEAAAAILPAYEQALGVSFPLDKLDLIVRVPCRAGAPPELQRGVPGAALKPPRHAPARSRAAPSSDAGLHCPPSTPLSGHPRLCCRRDGKLG